MTATSRTSVGTSEAHVLDPEVIEKAFKLFGELTNVGVDRRIEQWEHRGLTTGQLRLMVLLRDSPAGVALNEIARSMHVSPATITGITDRLVRRGLIHRQSDPNDRRIIRAVLTESGRSTLEALTVPGRAYLVDVFRRMGGPAFEQWIEAASVFIECAEIVRSENELQGKPS